MCDTIGDDTVAMRYHTTAVERAVGGPPGGRRRGTSVAVGTHYCAGDVGARIGGRPIRAAGYLNT